MSLKKSIFLKLFFVVVAYLAHGRLFSGELGYFYALLVTFFLIFGIPRNIIDKRLFVMAILLLGLSYLIPERLIPEQHQILLTPDEKIIPPLAFLAEEESYPYAPSADGFLQGFKDRRLVRTIKFEGNVLGLRTGYINHIKYVADHPYETINRREMPFVVKYTVTPKMIGMVLYAEGFFNFTAMDARDHLIHRKMHIQFSPLHIGHHFYGFGGTWDASGMQPLKLSLIKTSAYAFYEILKLLSLFLGLILLFTSLFKIKLTPDTKIEMVLFTLMSLVLLTVYRSVLVWGILDSGSCDGIRHAGYPYAMLEAVIAGDWFGALMSPERVFYFMPGMRYVRFMEMMLFGDAYVFQICMLTFIPVIIYRFYRFFLSSYLAVALTLMGSVFYVKSMMKQYGEWLSYALLFLGLGVMLRKIASKRQGILVFLLMAIAVSIRPNLAVFIGMLTLAHLLTSFFSPLTLGSKAVMLLGFTPLLLLPLHNYLGGEFVWVTSSSGIPQNVGISPGLYAEAFTSLFGLLGDFEGGSRFMRYLQRMWPLFIPLLLLSVWIGVKSKEAVVKLLAFACSAGLILHLFYYAAFRYIFPYLHICLTLFLYEIQKMKPNLFKLGKSF